VKAAIGARKRFLTVVTSLSLLGIGTLVVVVPTVLAGPPKPDYSLAAPQQTVIQPAGSATETADFTITMVPGAGGYTSPVALNFKNLPKGTSAEWSALDTDGRATVPSGGSLDLLVTVTSAVKVGTYTFTVTGVNASTGKDARDTKVTLGVASPNGTAPSYSLTVNPIATTVTQGDSAKYVVQLLSASPPASGVTLTAKGLPGGTIPSFSSNPLMASGANSTLSLATTSKTHTGSYHFTIEGASGKTHYSVVVQLTVQASAGASTFTLALSPLQQQIAAGGVVTFDVGISRNNFDNPIDLSISPLPTDAVAAFDPSTSLLADPSSGTSSTLTISTSAVTTPDGTFDFMVTGVGGSPQKTVTVKAKLVIQTPSGRAFGISGSPSSTLTPGGPAQSIDLLLSNPNDKAVLVTRLAVSVSGTSVPGCPTSSFVVTQYTGAYPLRVEKKSSVSLSALGVPFSQLPTVQLVDLPEQDQTLCKNAVATLSYAGDEREAT
jgi:hypothetical protein